VGNRLATLEKKDTIATNFATRRFLKPLAFVFMAWSQTEMTSTHWNTLMEDWRGQPESDGSDVPDLGPGTAGDLPAVCRQLQNSPPGITAALGRFYISTPLGTGFRFVTRPRAQTSTPPLPPVGNRPRFWTP